MENVSSFRCIEAQTGDRLRGECSNKSSFSEAKCDQFHSWEYSFNARRRCFNKIVKVDILSAYTLCLSLSNFVARAQAVLRLLSGGVFMYLEFCDTCENVQ